VLSVGSFFSYVNDARSHEPETKLSVNTAIFYRHNTTCFGSLDPSHNKTFQSHEEIEML